MIVSNGVYILLCLGVFEGNHVYNTKSHLFSSTIIVSAITTFNKHAVLSNLSHIKAVKGFEKWSIHRTEMLSTLHLIDL